VSGGIRQPNESDIAETTDSLLTSHYSTAVAIRSAPKQQLLKVIVPIPHIDVLTAAPFTIKVREGKERVAKAEPYYIRGPSASSQTSLTQSPKLPS
jgi:tRNA A37 threonylcarbamoyladenosine modification protein TsaB